MQICLSRVQGNYSEAHPKAFPGQKTSLPNPCPTQDPSSQSLQEYVSKAEDDKEP